MRHFRWIVVTLAITLLMACGGAGRIPDGGINQQAAEINVKLGLSYLQKDRLDLAVTKLDRALTQAPDSSRVNWAYALLEDKLGKTSSADQYFRKAIKLNHEDSEAHNNYGAFLCRQGRVQDALKEFEAAVSNPLYQTPEYAYLNAGMCAAGNDDAEQAEVYFRKALDTNGRYVSALYQMALLTYRQKHYFSSRAFRQRADDGMTVNDPKLLWLCVMTERELDNPAEADECARKLMTEFPTSKEATSI